MKRFICLLSLLLAAGCSTGRSLDEHVQFTPALKTTFFRDQWVQRGQPEVHMQPAGQAAKPPKVLFMPFRVTQPMDDSTVFGYSTARTIWQTWNTMQLFPYMEFSPDDVPYRRDRAIAFARARNADMVVGGFVTYIYAGGTAGDTQIAVQIEAHDVRTGQLVWSFGHSGLMPASKRNDYFLFATQTRLPSDPMHAIIQVIAGDTGKILQNWMLGGPSALTRTQEVDRDVSNTVFGEPDPIPSPRRADEEQAAAEMDPTAPRQQEATSF